MATQKLNLTRDQLATFLKNHELVKQFERLFQVADEVAPNTDTQGTAIIAESAQAAANSALAQLLQLANDMAINSGNADSKAQQALDALNRIANAVELAALKPAAQNNNSVVTDYIDLPEDGPHVTQQRRVQWNRDDGTMDVGLYGGSVLQVGQEIHYYAKNTSGALIPSGTPVMFTGSIGASGKLTFGLAVADGSVPADYMMGVATQDIADNALGYVTNFGLVRGFDTTGTPYGEVWVDGDLLYFGAAAPGTWTKVQPISPRIDVPVAVVVNAGSGGSGSIFVRMTVAESLARLQDVYISGLANGDLLQYDSVQQRWENIPASTLPVGTATNLAGGATGSVPYQSAVGLTTFLGIGVAYGFMRVNAGATAPEWAAFNAGAAISLVSSAGQLTITNTAPDQVVSLSGAGTTSVSGTYPNFTITSNDNYVGTVTNVSVSLGTTGTNISFSVANGTTTPAITLNVPTASATNRGALSSTDWSTFNSKEPAIAAGTTSDYYRGDKVWATLATDVRLILLTGLSTATNAVITATDTILSAFGKLQAQLNALGTAALRNAIGAGDLYSRGGILGTVSQSSGVPTGSVIQRGSNANGEYVRFADGTQICTFNYSAGSQAISSAFLGGFRTGGLTWTYPIAFTATPIVSIQANDASAFGSSISTAGATNVLFFLTAVTSQAAATRTCHVTAIGRWF